MSGNPSSTRTLLLKSPSSQGLSSTRENRILNEGDLLNKESDPSSSQSLAKTHQSFKYRYKPILPAIENLGHTIRDLGQTKVVTAKSVAVHRALEELNQPENLRSPYATERFISESLKNKKSLTSTNLALTKSMENLKTLRSPKLAAIGTQTAVDGFEIEKEMDRDLVFQKRDYKRERNERTKVADLDIWDNRIMIKKFSEKLADIDDEYRDVMVKKSVSKKVEDDGPKINVGFLNYIINGREEKDDDLFGVQNEHAKKNNRKLKKSVLSTNSNHDPEEDLSSRQDEEQGANGSPPKDGKAKPKLKYVKRGSTYVLQVENTDQQNKGTGPLGKSKFLQPSKTMGSEESPAVSPRKDAKDEQTNGNKGVEIGHEKKIVFESVETLQGTISKLLHQYSDMAAHIRKNHDEQKTTRMNIHDLGIKIKEAQEEITSILRRYNDMEDEIQRGSSKTLVVDKSIKLNRRTGFKDEGIVEDFMKMQRVKYERDKQVADREAKLKTLQMEMASFSSKIKILEFDLHNLKLKREKTRYELKEIYLTILGNERYHRVADHGLSWIVKSLQYLGFTSSFDSFPDYLEPQSIRSIIRVMREQKHCTQSLLLGRSQGLNTS
eukprot:TRINITY_DN6993_c0_g1_i4.p1 TRINITY_DN6993_c0_g1~~TRINITY_DN6993_c0_g1_i4.p1  ORF type:complete len:608 (+),score=86.90 TRINITY_DN6993_c0_g1_i4:103-1926(+)